MIIIFDLREVYKKYNEKIYKDYNTALVRIDDIRQECCIQEKNSNNKNYFDFFATVSNFILKIMDLEKKLNDEYFEINSFDKLLKENSMLFNDLVKGNYETSYANTEYCVKTFGDGLGQLMVYFYMGFREYISYAFSHKIFIIHEYNRRFIKVYEYIKNNEVEYEKLRVLITNIEYRNLQRNQEITFIEEMSSENNPFNNIIKTGNLKDLRYVFRYGKYITENEIDIAKYLLDYPQEKIELLSKSTIESFLRGFKVRNKDRKSRSVVKITHIIGLERITRQLLVELENRKMKPIIAKIISTDVNRQLQYDHRFDDAIYFDKNYLDLKTEAFSKAAQNCSSMINEIAGKLVMLKFGDKPFYPQSKNENLILSDEQSKLVQEYKTSVQRTMDKYIVPKETSYSGIAFPTPQIGSNFKEIFDDILTINTMDSEKYERIQQIIIDALDKGEYIYVKGKGKNETDIKVKMHFLKNPENETNFVNCGADVNIPLGETYTTPVLKGTDGVLHVGEVLIRDIKFKDLKFSFVDGYIQEYTCRNFDEEEKNKRIIEENILFPHKTLPLGEFAIGTNTLAYVIARKHGITDVLHTLMIEKMGPHFAVGDTCFARSEDLKLFNIFNDKEVIAKENEKTAQRNTNIIEAYTNTHTDITIPYDSIEVISVILKQGEHIDIIRDGIFALSGTDILNRPLLVGNN